MTGSKTSRNLWCLTVLCLLREGPRHPYEMQRLIRERHKDDFLQLKPGSLYHAIERLAKAGLIEEVETSREGRRPERTVYRLTECGDVEALEWLRGLLSKPVREPSQFVAAMSFVAHLTPDDCPRAVGNPCSGTGLWHRGAACRDWKSRSANRPGAAIGSGIRLRNARGRARLGAIVASGDRRRTHYLGFWKTTPRGLRLARSIC